MKTITIRELHHATGRWVRRALAGYAALLGQVRAHSEAGAFRWLAPDEETFMRIAQVYQKLPASGFSARPMPCIWLRLRSRDSA